MSPHSFVSLAGFTGSRAQRGAVHPLLLMSLVIAVLVGLPIFGVLSNLVMGNDAELGTFAHLWSTVLPMYIGNTLILAVTVTVLTAIMGIGCAWLVAVFDFPGRRFFEWALILPLAMPAYVVAYAYTDFLQFAGPVQSGLRTLLGVQGPIAWFPEIRSIGGAGLVFAFVLYPYVYLLVRNAFLERSPRMWDAARTLGSGPWQAFVRVSLPLARPAAVAGVALVLMETLADFGAVDYFGIQTLTTGIYKSWYTFSDRTAAAQIASVLLIVVFALMVIEKRSRGRARYNAVGARAATEVRAVLGGRHALCAQLFCAVPILLGFVLPFFILARLLLDAEDVQIGARYLHWLGNTVWLGGVTALLAVVICVVIAYSARVSGGPLQRASNAVVGMGYAIPGAVIAVGILIPIARIDDWSAGQGMNFLLAGSVLALIYAYLVRFLSVSLQSVQAGLERITPAMDASARSLGHGLGSMLRRVHAPLLWRSALTAGLLVFVDVVKELPATLTIRPFNMDTLAVITYQLAADERLGEAALPAFTIVLIAIVPVVILARAIAHSSRSR